MNVCAYLFKKIHNETFGPMTLVFLVEKGDSRWCGVRLGRAVGCGNCRPMSIVGKSSRSSHTSTDASILTVLSLV